MEARDDGLMFDYSSYSICCENNDLIFKIKIFIIFGDFKSVLK